MPRTAIAFAGAVFGAVQAATARPSGIAVLAVHPWSHSNTAAPAASFPRSLRRNLSTGANVRLARRFEPQRRQLDLRVWCRGLSTISSVHTTPKSASRHPELSIPVPDTCYIDLERENSLSKVGLRVLTTPDPLEKAKITHAAYKLWRDGALKDIGSESAPDHPARPPVPQLVSPRQVPQPRANVVPLVVHCLHTLAHVELNAIDLAWDTIVRFSGHGLPSDFYGDFLQVADDEARHFGWLARRLAAHDSFYGVMPAHSILWDTARDTKHDLASRLAVVPLVQEARGLDAGPRFIQRMISVGDLHSANVVRQIAHEEEKHVKVGMRWFTFVCDQQQIDAVSHFHACVRKFSPGLRPPFNDEARARSGLSKEWYMPVACAP